MQRKICLVLFVVCLLPSTWASNKSFSFWCRTKIVQDYREYYENRCHTYNFTMEVISDSRGRKQERQNNCQPFIYAYPGERYCVVLHNPLPVRAAVNLRVDGLNSITGNPGAAASGSKWLLSPHSSVTIRGWQVNMQSSRRFYFTSIEDSYAKWRSYQMGKDLTVKCGRISAAFFWSKREMENYFENNPIYLPYPPFPMKENADKRCKSSFNHDRNRAGTGMGEKNHHPVQMVNFYYDTGMYREKDAVGVFYRYSPPYPQQPMFAPEK